MHNLIIHNLGPIGHCELECVRFMALTGLQASGKSTIAKVIYFFRTIKEDILELAKRQAFHHVPVGGLEDEYDAGYGLGLKKGLENLLREKFLRTFGSSWGMPNDMYVEYHFSKTCRIKISLKEDKIYETPNYIWVTLSADIKDFLRKKDAGFSASPLGVPEEELKEFRKELYELFDDNASVVYIPAGRSMITLLSQQLSYIYATMDDMQKRSLDSCTKDYLERTLRMKQEFSEGIQGLAAHGAGKASTLQKEVALALDLNKKILRGAYRYSNGEEQIILDNGRYVKINFSSSGQQECVWILNLLFYYLLQPQKILFIIEEPESHLFPESQKLITELIALVGNCKHSVLLTTHSPYVLGTLNNLLYAYTISGEDRKGISEVIPAELWLDHAEFDAWFVKNGTVENCMDPELSMIQNERIDEISQVINQEFDELLEFQKAGGE